MRKKSMNDKEAMRALIAGKKIQHETVANGYFWLNEDGKLCVCNNDDGTDISDVRPFWNDGKWEVFEETKHLAEQMARLG